MNKVRILLVEDEISLAQIVKDSLETREFSVDLYHDGKSALEGFYKYAYDILVLDIMLPEMDGFSLAKEIRKTNTSIPIIFLTAKSQTEDVVKGFELGGNDYLKKPFSMEELIVRVKSLLGRSMGKSDQDELLQIGKYRFYPKEQRLELENTQKELTHRESEILRLLFENRNQVMERSPVLKELWGEDHFFNARSMDVFITKLRKYLKSDSEVKIVNIRGIGYKLIIP